MLRGAPLLDGWGILCPGNRNRRGTRRRPGKPKRQEADAFGRPPWMSRLRAAERLSSPACCWATRIVEVRCHESLPSQLTIVKSRDLVEVDRPAASARTCAHRSVIRRLTVVSTNQDAADAGSFRRSRPPKRPGRQRCSTLTSSRTGRASDWQGSANNRPGAGGQLPVRDRGAAATDVAGSASAAVPKRACHRCGSRRQGRPLRRRCSCRRPWSGADRRLRVAHVGGRLIAQRSITVEAAQIHQWTALGLVVPPGPGGSSGSGGFESAPARSSRSLEERWRAHVGGARPQRRRDLDGTSGRVDLPIATVADERSDGRIE